VPHNYALPRIVLIFRVLIISSLVLAIFGGVIDEVIPDLLPKVLDDAWDSYDSEEQSWASIAIIGGFALVLLVVGLVATIGLLLLRRWARPLALWTTVISVVMYPLLGAMVYSAWALMLTESATVMWGAALAMAYFSELRTHFER
jgi:urea transporter